MRATEGLKLPLSLRFKLNEREIHTNESLAVIVAVLLDELAWNGIVLLVWWY